MKRAYRNRDLIKTLDTETDYLRIYQLTTLYDFPTDMRVGLNLAFYRIFAIPHMAGCSSSPARSSTGRRSGPTTLA